MQASHKREQLGCLMRRKAREAITADPPEWQSYDEATCEVPSLDQLIESLTKSTYLNPVTVDLEINEDNEGRVMLKAVVTHVQAVYVGVAAMKGHSPVGCYAHPDYHFEGWLLKSGYDPYGGVVRVRGQLNTYGETPEIMKWRLEFSPPGPLLPLKER
jgi:hypothetical protein